MRLCNGHWVGESGPKMESYLCMHIRPPKAASGTASVTASWLGSVTASVTAFSTESLPVEAADEELYGSVVTTADLDSVTYVWVPRARPLHEEDFHRGVVFHFPVGFAG